MTMLLDAQVDGVIASLRANGRRDARRWGVTVLVLLLVLLVLVVATVTHGSSVSLPFGDALRAATGRGEGLAQFVVWETLLPRVLVATLAGLLLGLSGTVYQRLVGNVLATPDIVGVTAGAAAGGIVVLLLIGRNGAPTQIGALIGASVAVVAIMSLATGRQGVVHRIVLVGIGISACFASVTSYALAQADEQGLQMSMRWLVGSLHAASWPDVRVLAVTAVLTGAVLIWLARDLDAMRLGDDVASGLGTRVRRARYVLLLTGAVMAAMATSVVGPVAFVALVAGPIASRLPSGGVVAAGLVGAIVLAGSDLMGQIGPGISPVPAGAITALVGAPVLVVLLLARRTTV